MGAGRNALLLALAMIGPVLAGCVETSGDAGVRSIASDVDMIRVYSDEGSPLGFASVVALLDGRAIALLSTDADGVLDVSFVPESATHLRFSASGYAPRTVAVADIAPEVFLDAISSADEMALDADAPVLRFLAPVRLECPTGTIEDLKDQAFSNCGGFGEPQVEVAGDGTVWASGVCCVGRSPPIWRSFDGGLSFEVLEGQGTGVTRDAFGIEGDFAIDDAGNVYFFDISAATSWFTAYRADGTHRHTVAHVFEPAVDRPWVRAGVEDEVFVVYNRIGSTQFYRSTDGALTFDLANGQNFPCGLGGFGQGPDRDLLMVGTSCGPEIYVSRDGGTSWTGALGFPTPEGSYPNGRIIDNYVMTSADDAGNIYVTFTHAIDANSTQVAVFMSRMDAAGQWSGPFQVSPAGIAEKPWPVAGKDGRYGVAFYYTNHTNYQNQDGAEWYLMAAASVDAQSDDPHFQLARADPDPVLGGSFGRNLGDFLQARNGPGGEMVIVYGRDTGPEGVQNMFVQSDAALDLTQAVFLNGPQLD